MTADPHNGQYSDPPFGMGGIASTGAGGSPSVQDSPPGVGGGPVIARPVVSIPGYSSQLPEGTPSVPVTAGDTCAVSSDTPVPASGDPLTGLTLADITTTGAGLGSGHAVHPNSQARPS
jgi:hypothetical protein